MNTFYMHCSMGSEYDTISVESPKEGCEEEDMLTILPSMLHCNRLLPKRTEP